MFSDVEFHRTNWGKLHTICTFLSKDPITIIGSTALCDAHNFTKEAVCS